MLGQIFPNAVENHDRVMDREAKNGKQSRDEQTVHFHIKEMAENGK